jgi:hypothetical protein
MPALRSPIRDHKTRLFAADSFPHPTASDRTAGFVTTKEWVLRGVLRWMITAPRFLLGIRKIAKSVPESSSPVIVPLHSITRTALIRRGSITYSSSLKCDECSVGPAIIISGVASISNSTSRSSQRNLRIANLFAVSMEGVQAMPYFPSACRQLWSQCSTSLGGSPFWLRSGWPLFAAAIYHRRLPRLGGAREVPVHRLIVCLQERQGTIAQPKHKVHEKAQPQVHIGTHGALVATPCVRGKRTQSITAPIVALSGKDD